jgi:hypothetical protein
MRLTPDVARLFADFFLGANAQRIFRNHIEYVNNPEVEHRFHDMKEDPIGVMELTTKKELDSCAKKSHELAR